MHKRTHGEEKVQMRGGRRAKNLKFGRTSHGHGGAGRGEKEKPGNEVTNSDSDGKKKRGESSRKQREYWIGCFWGGGKKTIIKEDE